MSVDLVRPFPPASPALAADPVLRTAKAALAAAFGPRLVQVLVFGSRARGEARPDSDYDLIAVVSGPRDKSADRRAALDAAFEAGAAHDAAVNVAALTLAELGERTGFLHNVRADARVL